MPDCLLTIVRVPSVRSRSSQDFQFLVISLKNAFFEKSNALVGIWRDVDGGSSKTLTLDLEKY